MAVAACLCVCALNAQDLSGGLPLPQVPDSLRQPNLRADYVLEHYWDAMDFSNRKYALDDAFVEQAFANYASVMPIADADRLQPIVDALMERASVDTDAYNKLADVARIYLFEENSPVYNEMMYRYFVVALLNGGIIDDAKRSRLEFQLEMIDKNAPGTKAADFKYVARDGNEYSLAGTIEGRAAMVIFYDPDCDDCHTAISLLKSEPIASDLVSAGKLNIIAIADAETRDRWQESSLNLPQGWIDGCDVTGIQDEDLYVITHTPTFYWIGSDGKVVLKNRGLGEMLAEMQKLAADE